MNARAIRPFIGATDFARSRAFYREIGFTETVLEAHLSVFELGDVGFYLQDAAVPDWINNTQLFLEVRDLDATWAAITAKDLPARFPGARVSAILSRPWGREAFLHDPSGVLWHVGHLVARP